MENRQSSINYSKEVIRTNTGTPEPTSQPDVRSLSSPRSNPNASQASLISSVTSIHEQLQRMNRRLRRLAKQRRLISLLLGIYVAIMCGLLLIILMLLWKYLGYSPIIYHSTTITQTSIVDGATKYGEKCSHTSDCQRPLVCEKPRSPSSSPRCQCPANYDRISDRCVGDLDAVCSKDTDCQQYMLCSGMPDGKRRCHCQTLFHYDLDRRRCRGEYHAPCQSHTDCLANLLCNRSWCSCESHYRYDPLAQKCRGDAGARCDEATAECAENAECRDGACECAFQFIPDQNQTCVDPCPGLAASPARIRYPGNCRRFIDCRRRLKSECPEKTIFNFRTQLCDYSKNVLDCS